jgi:hypothetical protein
VAPGALCADTNDTRQLYYIQLRKINHLFRNTIDLCFSDVALTLLFAGDRGSWRLGSSGHAVQPSTMICRAGEADTTRLSLSPCSQLPV